MNRIAIAAASIDTLFMVMMDQNIVAEVCKLEDYKMMAKWGILWGGFVTGRANLLPSLMISRAD